MTVLKYLNLGGLVSITYLGDLPLRPPVTLVTGDSISLTVPEGLVGEVEAFMAVTYSDVVPIESERARAFEEERKAREQARIATEREQAEKAQAWLAEHPVPDYVIEYLGGEDG